MVKKIFLAISILSLTLACTSKHDEMLQQLAELEAVGDSYDAFPNDTVAMDVVAHMERCGTPDERQRAWKMMAKVYRRKGWNFFEESAWSMAVGCVDTTQAFDTLALAQTLFDWSHCLDRSIDNNQSRVQLERAIRYAMAVGDTIRAMRYYGDINSDSAYHYLWNHGEKTLAMDASMPMIEGMITGCRNNRDSIMLDSAATLLRRYAQYTSYNVESPFSYEANRYWIVLGKLYKTREQYDSAIVYFHKVADMDSLRWDAASYATDLIAECYRQMGNEDSANCYLGESIHLTELAAHGIVGDRFKSRFRDYQIHRDNLELHEEAERLHLWMLSGLFVLVGGIIFSLYRYSLLRRQHREALLQNREYADMLESLRSQEDDSILNTPIAQRFHELSSLDAHPTDGEWEELMHVIGEQYPELFGKLSENHELSLQEQRIICLITIKCTPLQMSILLVCTKSNISNFRRRLYGRITGTEGNGTDLDKLVNSLCE